MKNMNINLEKRREDYEKGKISFEDLSPEEVNTFGEYYIKEIKENKKEIQKTRIKIKELEEKMKNVN